MSLRELLTKRHGEICPEIRGITDTEVLNGRIVGKAIVFTSNPKIDFKLKKFIGATSALAQIDIIFRHSNKTLYPRLYVDYGMGFEDKLYIVMSPFGDVWSAFIPMPHLAKSLRLSPLEAAGEVEISSLIARRVSALQLAELVLRKGARVSAAIASRRAIEGVQHLNASLERFGRSESDDQSAIAIFVFTAINASVPAIVETDAVYLDWIAHHETPNEDDIVEMRKRASEWGYSPLISVLMPVYDPPIKLLEEAIASLQSQIYENWELCLADDASTNPAVRKCIERFAAYDPRIRPIFREINGHISEASNSAASIARGEWLVLMDNDDLLPIHALWTVVHYARLNPSASIMFSDEDKISPGGSRAEPYFKGCFDRFLLYGHNMFCHLGIYRRALFERVGGFRRGYEGSQDYDLTLRSLDEAGEDSVVHIPHVLYHWRQIPGSTSLGASEKSYAFKAAKRAINDHFERNNWPLYSDDSGVPGVSVVNPLSTANPETVSVVISSRDGFEQLSRCIASMRRFADPLVEVIIVDNGSVDSYTLDYLATLGRESHRYIVVRDDGPFNFSRLVNLGVANARGRIVCLLNDDTEFLDPGAFERARAWLSISDIGIVGARLLYPDGAIQHFGVHIGVGEHGIAGHPYSGLPDGQYVNFSKSKLLQQFSAVTGACMFIRTDDFRNLNGLDENFAVVYNDIDLCLRARLKGLKIICDPAIRLIHHESSSRVDVVSPANQKKLDDDAKRMYERWGKNGLKDAFCSPNYKFEQSGYKLNQDPPPVPWKLPLSERH